VSKGSKCSSCCYARYCEPPPKETSNRRCTQMNADEVTLSLIGTLRSKPLPAAEREIRFRRSGVAGPSASIGVHRRFQVLRLMSLLLNLWWRRH
jgi:hypothetical protein